VEPLSALQRLVLGGMGQLRKVGLEGLPLLQHLEIRDCSELQEIDGLEQHGNLHRVVLCGLDRLKAVDVESLTALRQLQITECGQLLELRGLLRSLAPAVGCSNVLLLHSCHSKHQDCMHCKGVHVHFTACNNLASPIYLMV
jgi:hypothetical protein